MKFTKMSLVAALLIGSSAFAIENTKVSGDAKLFYSTSDNTYSTSTAGAKTASDSLFGKGNAMGEAAISLGVTADLTKGISAGFKGTAITTLGLYNNLVSSTWTGGTEDTYVVTDAWLAATVGKTTGKIGRMSLDTPLVFTETWSLVENTFEAAVLINQDIPDTTLVGAYVGQHDSAAVLGGGLSQGASPFSKANGSFYNGAYAVGVVNNSFKPLTVQGWYYGAQTNFNVGTFLTGTANAVKMSHVDAYWLQADFASKQIPGLLAGAQYTHFKGDLKNAVVNDVSNSAYALMLGYEMKDVATVKVSYSDVSKTSGVQGVEVGAGFNLATVADNAGVARHAQSKLYTEAWWNYGYVTKADTSAWNITATGKVASIDLGAYYTSTNSSKNNTATQRADMDELTLTAGKTVGPLDATLAYVYTKADDQNDKTANGIADGQAYNAIQAYLTLNF